MHRFSTITVAALALALSLPLAAWAGQQAGTGSAGPAVAQPRPCTDVTARTGRVDVAAGTTYVTVRLRNTADRKCVIGQVRMAFVNRHRIMVGWPAEQLPGADRWQPRAVQAHHAVRATLRIPNPGNLSRMDCLGIDPWRLRVRAAQDRTPDFTRADWPSCTTRFGRASVGRYVG